MLQRKNQPRISCVEGAPHPTNPTGQAIRQLLLPRQTATMTKAVKSREEGAGNHRCVAATANICAGFSFNIDTAQANMCRPDGPQRRNLF